MTFKLHGIKKKIILACGTVVVLGCTTFGVIGLVNNLKEAQASSDNNHLQDVTLDQMTKMEVGAVYTGAFDETAGPIGSVQSLAITDKYFVVTQLGYDGGNWGMLTATSLKNPSSTPAWSVSHDGVGHGNGATWNSKTNEIVVASGETSSGPGTTNIYFFDANNGSRKRVEEHDHASGIAYDEEDDWYVTTSEGYGRVFSNNLQKKLLEFDANHGLTNQDVAYYNGYIYRVAYSNSGKFGSVKTIIYQFNMSGEFTGAFYANTSGEVESMAFDADGTPYLLIAFVPDATHYRVYEVTNADALNKMKGRKSQAVSFATAAITKKYGEGNFTNAATTSGNGSISYESSNTDVATVNASTGEVKIVGVGTAKITANASRTNEYKAGTGSYTLTVGYQDATITFADTSTTITKTYGDNAFTNKATATSGGTVTYASDDEKVATVNASTGEVKIKGAGTAKITASVGITNTYGAASKTYTLKVNKKKSANPTEVQSVKEGYYMDALSTVKFTTSGLVWEDANEVIGLGKHTYSAQYTENNDAANYTTEAFEVTVNGLRRKYDVVAGDNQVLVLDSEDGEYSKFVFDADYALFKNDGEVFVDGKELDKENYTSYSGSTVIEVKNSYFNTLLPGEHILAAYFGDGGVAEAKFTLKEKPHNDDSGVVIPEEGNSVDNGNTPSSAPQTGSATQGDGSKIVLEAFSMLPMMAVAVIVLGGAYTRMKKQKRVRNFGR